MRVQTIFCHYCGHVMEKCRRHDSSPRVDANIRTAHQEGLSVRLIVLKGRGRNLDPDIDRSRAELRLFDHQSWVITDYDPDTGDCHLTRSVRPMPTHIRRCCAGSMARHVNASSRTGTAKPRDTDEDRAGTTAGRRAFNLRGTGLRFGF